MPLRHKHRIYMQSDLDAESEAQNASIEQMLHDMDDNTLATQSSDETMLTDSELNDQVSEQIEQASDAIEDIIGMRAAARVDTDTVDIDKIAAEIAASDQ